MAASAGLDRYTPTVATDSDPERNPMNLRKTLVSATLGVAAAAGISAAVASTSAAAATTVPACTNAAIGIHATATTGAAGHGALVLRFQNVSAHTCSLYGYPGLDALTASGRVLAHARRTLSGYMGGATAVRTAVIRPGAWASAVVEWMNFNPTTGGACRFSSLIATTPPNTTHTQRFARSVSICDLQVHPTVPGISGVDEYAVAKREWVAGSKVSMAQEGAYWLAAERALKQAGMYPAQVAELAQLITLPDADQTPTQNAEWRHDVTALDSFFQTPGLYL
jgi:hypothetical protein